MNDTTVREVEANRQISRRCNGIVLLGPIACLFSVCTFIFWCSGWLIISKMASDLPLGSSALCTQPVSSPWFRCLRDSAYNEKFARIHASAVCVFLLITLLHSNQVHSIMTDSRRPRRRFSIFPPQWTSIFCSHVVLFIGFLAHLFMSLNIFPKLLSARGRLLNIALSGQRIAVMPVLVSMMYAFDVREKDFKRILITIAFLMSSVISDFVAEISYLNPSRERTISMFSGITFAYIFIPLYQCYWRNKTLNQYFQSTSRVHLVGFMADLGSKRPMFQMREHFVHEKGVPLVERDFIVKEVVACVNNQSIFVSYNLARFCVVSWTIIASIHVLGAFHLIGHFEEDLLMTIFDVIANGIFSVIVCSTFDAQLVDVHRRTSSIENESLLPPLLQRRKRMSTLHAYDSDEQQATEELAGRTQRKAVIEALVKRRAEEDAAVLEVNRSRITGTMIRDYWKRHCPSHFTQQEWAAQVDLTKPGDCTSSTPPGVDLTPYPVSPGVEGSETAQWPTLRETAVHSEEGELSH